MEVLETYSRSLWKTELDSPPLDEGMRGPHRPTIQLAGYRLEPLAAHSNTGRGRTADFRQASSLGG